MADCRCLPEAVLGVGFLLVELVGNSNGMEAARWMIREEKKLTAERVARRDGECLRGPDSFFFPRQCWRLVARLQLREYPR